MMMIIMTKARAAAGLLRRLYYRAVGSTSRRGIGRLKRMHRSGKGRLAAGQLVQGEDERRLQVQRGRGTAQVLQAVAALCMAAAVAVVAILPLRRLQLSIPCQQRQQQPLPQLLLRLPLLLLLARAGRVRQAVPPHLHPLRLLEGRRQRLSQMGEAASMHRCEPW